MGIIRKPFFVIPYQPALITSYSTPIAGYPASNLAKFDDIGLELRIASPGILIADLGSPKDIDFLGLISTNASSTDSCGYLLSNDASFNTFIHAEALRLIRGPASTNYSGRYHDYREIASTINCRYILADILKASGPEFSVAHLIVGKKIEFDRFYNRGHGMGFEDFGSFEMTSNGVPDITDGAILRTLKFEIGFMGKSDFILKYQPLIAAVKTTKPVYICFDPQDDEYRHSNTYFGWLKPPGFATIGQFKPEAHSQSFEMLSQI